MKKIASILFFAFLMVQTGSFFSYHHSEPASVCMMDEKTESDAEKKEITFPALHLTELTPIIITNLHQAENIQAAPCLEKLITPPDFC